ncbi:MAG: hypothetical protein ACLUW6_04950 [Coriobacteriaceae bacterium]
MGRGAADGGGGALALARFLYVPWLRRCAMVVAETIACGLAVVVAVYAGCCCRRFPGAAVVVALGTGALRTVGPPAAAPAHGRGAFREGEGRGR